MATQNGEGEARYVWRSVSPACVDDPNRTVIVRGNPSRSATFATTQISLLAAISNRTDDQAWQAAWERFLARYQPPLMLWAKRYVQHEIAEELVQELLLKLMKLIKRFRYDPTKGRFRDWLKVCLMNTCFDHFRAQSAILVDWRNVLEPSHRASLEESLREAFDLEALELALDGVRTRILANSQGKLHTFTIFQLTLPFLFGGKSLTNAEAAENQGVSPVVVATARKNCFKLLREELARLGFAMPAELEANQQSDRSDASP